MSRARCACFSFCAVVFFLDAADFFRAVLMGTPGRGWCLAAQKMGDPRPRPVDARAPGYEAATTPTPRWVGRVTNTFCLMRRRPFASGGCLLWRPYSTG